MDIVEGESEPTLEFTPKKPETSQMKTLGFSAVFLMTVLLADAEVKKPMKTEIGTLGGGCFWCVEAVYERLPGVVKVVSGYAGGKTKDPTSKTMVSHPKTRHSGNQAMLATGSSRPAIGSVTIR